MPCRTGSRRPDSPPCVSGAAMPWPSAWRCSDAGANRPGVRSLRHRSTRPRRGAGRRAGRDRGPDRDPAPRDAGPDDAAAAGGAARGRVARRPARRRLPDLLSRARRRGPPRVHAVRSPRGRPAGRAHRRVLARLPGRRVRGREAHRGRRALDARDHRRLHRPGPDSPRRPGSAADSHRQRDGGAATRYAPVPDRRPHESGDRRPGPEANRESAARAPMTARVSFAHRARAPAVAVVWIAAFALVGAAVGYGLTLVPLPLENDPRWALAWSSLPWAAGFALATWLVGRVLERRSWEELGWSPRASLPFALLGGVALGAAMAACAVGLAVIAGRAAITVTADGGGWRAAALPLGVGFLVAALAEELAFRGYPLRRLAAATGPLPATALTALGFGLLHLGNPGATVFSTANVALAGVWLAAALFSPGAMPLGWGAHFGWNATLALGFAAPVSGYAFPLPALAYRPGAHAWIDGGAFGPEGGGVSTPVMLAGRPALG